MRILFLAHRLPYPPDKGDKIRSFFELKTLSGRHDVDLLCFYDYAEDEQYLNDLRAYCHSVYAERLSWLSSRLRAFNALCTRHCFTLEYFHSPSMRRRVREALERTKYDLIFVFSSSMAQFVEDVDSVPRILDMVDVDSDKWRQYAQQSTYPNAWVWCREADLLSEYEKKITEHFPLTLVCTTAEAEVLRRRTTSANIKVLGNRLDESYWDPQATSVPSEIVSWQPYVIFTGSMDYFPNVDAAVYFCRECLPRLRRIVPGLRFVIAGRKPTRSVRRLASESHVIVTGAVPDMRPLLRGAEAAVAPLRVARGVQNKVLEAMAMDLPVISTSKVASALPGPLASYLWVEDDPGRMAKRIAEVVQYGSPIVSGKIRAALIEHCGSQNSERHLEELIVQVLEKDRRATTSHDRNLQLHR